jgi:polyisoprenoid-binding protein YceI
LGGSTIKKETGMKKWCLGLFSLALLSSLAFASATKYAVDPVHGSISFAIDFWGVNELQGLFHQYSGTIEYDDENVENSSVHVMIDIASVDTGNEGRDNHLQQDDYFDAEKYPHMVFQSKEIKKTHDGMLAVGDFFLHGVTNEISIPFTVRGPVMGPRDTQRIGIKGSTTIKRSDYNMAAGNTLENGMLMISDEVRITLDVSAVKQ